MKKKRTRCNKKVHMMNVFCLFVHRKKCFVRILLVLIPVAKQRPNGEDVAVGRVCDAA